MPIAHDFTSYLSLWEVWAYFLIFTLRIDLSFLVFLFLSLSSPRLIEKVHLTHKIIRRWADRRHPNKSKTWVTKRYFKTVEGNNWVFKSTGKYENALFNHADTPIIRHTKIKGEASPYNGETLYWGKRMSNHPEMKKSVANLLKKQKGKCNWCGLPFQEEDKLEIDHIKPVKAGGSNKLDNRQLLHNYCHDIKTKSDLRVIKQYKAQKERNNTLKQFNYLDWIWVNDIPTLVSGTHKEPNNRGAQ